MNSRVRFAAFFRSFWINSDRGSAAIEFAFVAPAFFALMLGILEVGTMTFGQFALQNAVVDAGRLLRTGQAQNISALVASGIPITQCPSDPNSAQVVYGSEQAWFTDQICCGVTPLLACNKLVVTVAAPATGFGSNFDSFQDPTIQGTYFKDPVTGVSNPAGQDAACKVVLVRATYDWTIWFPGLAKLLNGQDNFLVNTSDGGSLLSGTSAFRNEPFNSGVGGC